MSYDNASAEILAECGCNFMPAEGREHLWIMDALESDDNSWLNKKQEKSKIYAIHKTKFGILASCGS